MRAGTPAADAPDPSRNQETPKGRAVTAAEISPYALPLHLKCRGKGVVGYRGQGEERTAVPCACATKRFLRAHPEVVVDRDGRVWWPEDRKQGMVKSFEKNYGEPTYEARTEVKVLHADPAATAAWEDLLSAGPNDPEPGP